MIYNFNTRPYIVINGVDSRSIPGLIICSLPPITLPAKRVLAETIDGRSGDIVTELGYEAYDKVIEIGLAKEYNVDDIISFFAQEGKVVFGNEPDKYYNFANYSIINFERLIRYKTASVTLHIQPFKFSEDENIRKIVNQAISSSHLQFEVRNSGNIFSRPVLKIKASGDISLFINNVKILDIEFPLEETAITIDASEMEATYEDGSYANRLITGNYDNIRLKPGYNIISVSGAVEEVYISKTSRWL